MNMGLRRAAVWHAVRRVATRVACVACAQLRSPFPVRQSPRRVAALRTVPAAAAGWAARAPGCAWRVGEQCPRCFLRVCWLCCCWSPPRCGAPCRCGGWARFWRRGHAVPCQRGGPWRAFVVASPGRRGNAASGAGSPGRGAAPCGRARQARWNQSQALAARVESSARKVPRLTLPLGCRPAPARRAVAEAFLDRKAHAGPGRTCAPRSSLPCGRGGGLRAHLICTRRRLPGEGLRGSVRAACARWWGGLV